MGEELLVERYEELAKKWGEVGRVSAANRIYRSLASVRRELRSTPSGMRKILELLDSPVPSVALYAAYDVTESDRESAITTLKRIASPKLGPTTPKGQLRVILSARMELSRLEDGIGPKF